MATVNIAYGSDTSVTVTGLNSLADSSSVSSDAVDNSTNLFVDAIIEVELDGSAAGNTGLVNLWLKQAIDGSSYDTDENDQKIGSVQMNGTTAVSDRFSIARANGGIMPRHWKVRFENDSGAALESSGNTLAYRGVEYTVA